MCGGSPSVLKCAILVTMNTSSRGVPSSRRAAPIAASFSYIDAVSRSTGLAGVASAAFTMSIACYTCVRCAEDSTRRCQVSVSDQTVTGGRAGTKRRVALALLSSSCGHALGLESSVEITSQALGSQVHGLRIIGELSLFSSSEIVRKMAEVYECQELIRCSTLPCLPL